MSATIARLIGGAGTGKTTELLRIMQGVIDQGEIAPDQIGFVSFTRAARSEAAGRAAEKFGCKVEELEQAGWFRTLHSICYKCLQVGGELLIPSQAKAKRWLEGALQEQVDFSEGDDDTGMGVVISQGKTPAAKALAIWDAARSRLEPFSRVWEGRKLQDWETPDLQDCRRTVERYELHKALDHRLDFTDLLGQFSGWRFSFDGPTAQPPQGWVPELPVWFFDEQQDASRLLDAVCHRLIQTEACRWVYVVGDPFQAIYGFAGADSRCFREWSVAKERIMPKSFRCPKPIHELGEVILRDCGDYFDRGIAPADHPGEIETSSSIHEWIGQAAPSESWLFIARTNFQARRFASLLNREWTPWQPTKGFGGWAAPKRNKGLSALLQLQTGFFIGPDDWKAALELVPSRYSGEELLLRGSKTQWGTDYRPAEETSTLAELPSWGATPRLLEMIGQGTWPCLIENADRYVSAVKRWGYEATDDSKIKVGTIHSVKGQEADNVCLLTTTSEPVARSQETQEGADEERRVAYVGVTRARRRLVVINEPRERNRMEVPL